MKALMLLLPPTDNLVSRPHLPRGCKTIFNAKVLIIHECFIMFCDQF